MDLVRNSEIAMVFQFVDISKAVSVVFDPGTVENDTKQLFLRILNELAAECNGNRLGLNICLDQVTVDLRESAC